MKSRVFLPLFVLFLAACGPGADTPDGRDLSLANGCAACHGVDGAGDGPGVGLAQVKTGDLRDPASFSTPRTPEAIAATIARGIASMPSYAHLPENERFELARYVLSLSAAPRGIEISEPWARQPNPAHTMGAGYLKITNHRSGPVTLTGASSSAAGVVELHEMITADGIMSMRQVKTIPIAPGVTVELRPGGLHLMLIDLTRTLQLGETIDATLRFDDGSTRQIQLPVRHVE